MHTTVTGVGKGRAVKRDKCVHGNCKIYIHPIKHTLYIGIYTDCAYTCSIAACTYTTKYLYLYICT